VTHSAAAVNRVYAFTRANLRASARPVPHTAGAFSRVARVSSAIRLARLTPHDRVPDVRVTRVVRITDKASV